MRFSYSTVSFTELHVHWWSHLLHAGMFSDGASGSMTEEKRRERRAIASGFLQTHVGNSTADTPTQ